MARGENTRSGSTIRACRCSSDYQDTKYGKGQRVHTLGGTAQSPRETCTVCGNKVAAASVPRKKKEE